MNPVRCVSTAQSREIDYVGVVWARDLYSAPATNKWIADLSHSHEAIAKRPGDCFTDLVKRTYRVLLIRGFEGCHVCVEGAPTGHSFGGRLGRGPIG